MANYPESSRTCIPSRRPYYQGGKESIVASGLEKKVRRRGLTVCMVISDEISAERDFGEISLKEKSFCILLLYKS